MAGIIKNIINSFLQNNNLDFAGSVGVTDQSQNNNQNISAPKFSKRTFSNFMDLVKKNVASDQTTRINKKLAQDKDVNVSKVYSMRNYDDGNRPEGNARYWKGENVGRGLEDVPGNITEEVRSSAIDQVKYDPKQNLCWVKYVDGNGGWYSFKMNPKQFKTYMQSSSKGRYTQNVMRQVNYDNDWENHPYPN